MIGRDRAARRALLAATAALALGLAPAVAHADPYGQLTTFGTPGTGAGQFSFASGLAVNGAIAADPSDNSVYVADSPVASAGGGLSTLRVQKLTADGSPVASASIGIDMGSGAAPPRIQGLAVDPSLHRVYLYVALTDTNPSTPLTGARLYAFSTDTSDGSGVLHPASVSDSTGLFVDETRLPITGATALANPVNVAVDPTDDDILLSANSGTNSGLTIQRVHADGTLGSVWTGPGGFLFSTNGSGAGIAVTSAGDVVVEANSQVISGAVVLFGNAIWKLPAGYDASTVPTLISDGGNDLGSGVVGVGLQPGNPTTATYPSIAVAPGSDDVYGLANVPGGDGFDPNGIRVQSGVDGSYVGWFGAATGAAACTIPASVRFGTALAAGSGGIVWRLDPDTTPMVTRFGPGGSGCDHTTGGDVTMTQAGDPVAGDGTGTASVGAPVTFAGSVANPLGGNTAEALSTTWDFGDGSAPVTVAGGLNAPTVDHAFDRNGTYTVTATITTDDLADPAPLVETVRLSTSGQVIPPTASFTVPATAQTGDTVVFDGSGSVSPGITGAANGGIQTYHWDFGDQSQRLDSTTPQVSHVFSAAGTYAVTLGVTDANRVDSTDSFTQTITVTDPPLNDGGGNGDGTDTTTTTPPPPPPATTGTTPPPPPPPATTSVTPPPVKTPAAKVSVSSVKVASGKIAVAFKPSAAGKVTVTLRAKVGKRTITLASGHASVRAGKLVTLKLAPTSAGRKALAKKLKVTVAVAFTPTGGTAVSASKTASLKLAPPAKKKAKHGKK